MEKLAVLHKHPSSTETVFGNKLEMGDAIESTDVYATVNGTWDIVPTPYPGDSVGISPIYYVRPKLVQCTC